MKIIGLLALALLAFIAVQLYDQGQRPKIEARQAEAVEINHHKRIMARSRGYDTETSFDPRAYNEDGTRVDGTLPPAQAGAAPPPEKPGDWMSKSGSSLNRR